MPAHSRDCSQCTARAHTSTPAPTPAGATQAQDLPRYRRGARDMHDAGGFAPRRPCRRLSTRQRGASSAPPGTAAFPFGRASGSARRQRDCSLSRALSRRSRCRQMSATPRRARRTAPLSSGRSTPAAAATATAATTAAAASARPARQRRPSRGAPLSSLAATSARLVRSRGTRPAASAPAQAGGRPWCGTSARRVRRRPSGATGARRCSSATGPPSSGSASRPPSPPSPPPSSRRRRDAACCSTRWTNAKAARAPPTPAPSAPWRSARCPTADAERSSSWHGGATGTSSALAAGACSHGAPGDWTDGDRSADRFAGQGSVVARLW
mmetsp:Transcript_41135/g.134341  ORF Transcript_41135/g.134341 Transcript_41135/m.134341 type:complete len:326 (+) Transcript_41135:380-1357(+)